MAQQGGPSRHKTTDSLSPTGKDAYEALFQGRGTLAEEIPLVRDNYQASFFIADAEEDSLYNAFSDEMINAIDDVDPTFFTDFEGQIQSGDYFAVEDALEKAASITLEAALTIPEFRQQLQAAAEDAQVVSSAVDEIHQADPESEMTEEQLKSLLIELSSGEEPLCAAVAANWVYLYYAAAHWVFVAVNVAGAVNAAIWFAAFLFNHTWIFNKKKLPSETVVFGESSLTYEMLVDYIVQNWAAA